MARRRKREGKGGICPLKRREGGRGKRRGKLRPVRKKKREKR